MPEEPDAKFKQSPSPEVDGVAMRTIGLVGYSLRVALIAWATMLALASFGSDGNVLKGLALLVPLYFMTTLIHEGGHALGARLASWKVVIISVWWLSYHRFNRQIVLSRKVPMADASGWLFAIPPASHLNTFGRRAAVIIGGPIASVLQGLICFALAAFPALLSSLQVEEQVFHLHFAIASLGALGLASAAGTAIPMRTHRAKRENDAATLLAIWRQPDRDVANFTLAALLGLLRYKVRLRAIPDWMLTSVPTLLPINPQLPRALASLRAACLLDAEQVNAVKARKAIDYYQAQFGDDNWSLCCSAWISAVYEGDLLSAKAALEKLVVATEDVKIEHAARAAIAVREGNDEEAALHIKAMSAKLEEESPYRDLTYRDIRRTLDHLSCI